MTQPIRRIFISYRQADNADFVYRIRDWLMQRYGRDNVFMDFDNLPAFSHFEEYIKARIAECDAVLVIIGREWLPLLNEKEAQGDIDYVRIELEAALNTPNLILAPVCIKGARMPSRRSLPESLRAMCDINAAHLDGGRAFYDEIERLMEDIESAMLRPAKKQTRAASNMTPNDYLQRAKRRFQEQDWDGMIADATQVIRLSPALSPSAYAIRASAHVNKGDIDEAVADCNEAIRLDIDKAEAYRWRGAAFSEEGRYAEAIADFRHYIALDGEHAQYAKRWIRDNEEKLRRHK